MEDLRKHVEEMIRRAADKTCTPDNAMKITQAACNAANAMRVLKEIRGMA